MGKKISSLELKLLQILDNYGDDGVDLAAGLEARTLVEEEQHANECLREQLSTFRNATTGESLQQSFIDGVAGKSL